MLKFIIRRLFYGLLVVMGVVVVVFFMFHVIPGEKIYQFVGRNSTKENITMLNKEFYFDRPLYMQLLLYFNDLSPLSMYENTPENKKKYTYGVLVAVGDDALVIKAPYLRRSAINQERVDKTLFENLESTVVLALASMIFATFFGIFFGLLSAQYQGKWQDHFLSIFSVIGISAPSFVLAILISILFGFTLHSFTGLNMTGSLWRITDNGRALELKNIILPALTLGIRPLSTIVQLTRSAMLEVLSQDYIRTARAKGLPPRKVVFKHALKNALNPVITAVSGWLAALMAGAFFVEYIFNWKGLGWKTIEAVNRNDFPIIMGSTVVIACIFVIVNILTDILYAITDPRIRLQ